MPSLYLRAKPEDIGKYVVFSGDPWRVDVIKQYLDNLVEIAFAREYNTVTGYYKGVKVTVTSTGIGAPSAAIAMEEMYACGMEVAVRMGTAMVMEEDMLGHFVIPIGSIRRESTSLTYVEEGYPAIADLQLVNSMNETVRSFGKKFDNGINCTVDGFYTMMHESRLSKEYRRDIDAVLSELKTLGVAGVDMESSCLLTIGRLMGVKTAVVTVATVLNNLRNQLEGKEKAEAEDLLCKVVLEGIYNHHTKSVH